MFFAMKMLLENAYGLLNVIILIESFKQNLELKIKILAGNPVTT